MARSNTSFQPGVSGNPKGRPPKKRTLTNLLEKVANRKFTAEGEEIAAKQLFAAHIWEGLATGKITFPDSSILQLDSTSYINLAKFALGQIDGPPKAEMDVTTEGKALKASPTVDDMKGLMQIMGQRERDDSKNN